VPLTDRIAQRRPLARGRRSRVSVALRGLAVVVVALAGYAVWESGLPYVGRGGHASLALNPPGTGITHDARVGSTYNLGIPLRVEGRGAVEIRSVTLRSVTPGLDTPEPVLAWSCGGNEFWGGVVAADLFRLPKTGAVPLREQRITAESDACWYVLVPFVPRRLGRLRASGGTVTYRVGGRNVTREFRFSTAFEVTGTGRDVRDKQ